MNHDVIDDKYGRLYHLPYELSKSGHKVTGICLNYRGNKESTSAQSKQLLNWHSLNAGIAGWKIPLYIARLIKAIRRHKPDLLIGGSDALHVILTKVVGALTSTPYFIDLYDNFESFGLSKLPLMKYGYRKALRSAMGITTVSDALNRHIREQASCPVLTIESTISKGVFRPLDKQEARKALHLPVSGLLVGTAGSLAADRGTGDLYQTAISLFNEYPNMYLVLAGPVHDNPPPAHPNILYLGKLHHSQVPQFFNALDVAVICMRDTLFGKYAFPQKLYEILACRVPVAAARVGALEDLLSPYHQTLYSPDDVENLARVIKLQIQNPCIPDITPPNWADQARKIDCFFTENLQ